MAISPGCQLDQVTLTVMNNPTGFGEIDKDERKVLWGAGFQAVDEVTGGMVEVGNTRV